METLKLKKTKDGKSCFLISVGSWIHGEPAWETVFLSKSDTERLGSLVEAIEMSGEENEPEFHESDICLIYIELGGEKFDVLFGLGDPSVSGASWIYGKTNYLDELSKIKSFKLSKSSEEHFIGSFPIANQNELRSVVNIVYQ